MSQDQEQPLKTLNQKLSVLKREIADAADTTRKFLLNEEVKELESRIATLAQRGAGRDPEGPVAHEIERTVGNAIEGGNPAVSEESDEARSIIMDIESGGDDGCRGQVLALLATIQLGNMIPLDESLRKELANIDPDRIARRQILDDAAVMLAESGSRELSLPPGYINFHAGGSAFATELYRDAGKMGAPALAAICAATFLTWDSAMQAKRVFTELCMQFGDLSVIR